MLSFETVNALATGIERRDPDTVPWIGLGSYKDLYRNHSWEA